MSEYHRNTGMIVCIVAVLVIGAITVGGLTYLGSNGWWGNWNPAKTTFTFHADVGNTTGTVLLDVKLGAGGLTLQFVDNSSLLYRMSVVVQNSTLQQYGSPAVTFAGNKIALDYTAAGVNVTLGTGVRYAIHGNVTAGGISATLDHAARLANMSLTSSAGGITVVTTNQIVVTGDVPVDLHTAAGGISVNVGLPTGVGGSFDATVTAGGVTVNAPSWTHVTQNHYETANYNTASDKLTIMASTNAGGISANLG
jgi:hypothetical protein